MKKSKSQRRRANRQRLEAVHQEVDAIGVRWLEKQDESHIYEVTQYYCVHVDNPCVDCCQKTIRLLGKYLDEGKDEFPWPLSTFIEREVEFNRLLIEAMTKEYGSPLSEENGLVIFDTSVGK